MTAARRCSGTNEDGVCAAHREGGQEKMKELAHRGAEATRRARKGLDPEELPPLESCQAAETWCDVIGRAVTVGRIGHNEAKTALRAVREWRESREGGELADRLEDVEEILAQAERFNLEVMS